MDLISGMFDEMLSRGETVRAVGREGKQAAGLGPSFYPDRKPLEPEERLSAQPSSPPTSSPPCWLPLARQPALAKQPGAAGLFLSVPSGCCGSCFRKPFLPTIRAFSSEPGGERLAFAGRGRGRGSTDHHAAAVSPPQPQPFPGLYLTHLSFPRGTLSPTPSPLPSAF